MYRIKSAFTIGNYKIDFCNTVQIESGWADLTDTATLVLPRKIVDVDRTIFNGPDAIFNVGDPLDIELSYTDFDPVTRFKGFISDVDPKLPIRLMAEDAMFLMRRFTLTKSFKAVSLQELIDYVFTEGAKKETRLNDYKPVVNVSINLGVFRINRGTGAQVFEELKKKYGINTYVKGNEFIIGFSYSEVNQNTKTFTFEDNIIDDDLVYKKAEDVKLKVKAVSIDRDNKKTTIEIGDADGEQRTLHYYNKDEDTLRKLATEQLDKLKYTGYRGSFTTFLHPYVQHSQPINIVSKRLPERNGKYYIAKVNTNSGVGGGRQEITLDRVSL